MSNKEKLFKDIFQCLEEYETEQKDDDDQVYVKYYITNNDEDDPRIDISIPNFTKDNLNSFAKLMSAMSTDSFVYTVLAGLEQDFISQNKEEEFMELVKAFHKEREESDEVCVKPSDILG